MVPRGLSTPVVLTMLGLVGTYSLKASLKILPSISLFSPSLPPLLPLGETERLHIFFSEAELAISSPPSSHEEVVTAATRYDFHTGLPRGTPAPQVVMHY